MKKRKYPTLEYAKRYGIKCSMDVLEALNGYDYRRPTLAAVSGVDESTVYWATLHMIGHGLVVNMSGRFHITERGKIILAIHHGKQKRKMVWAAGFEPATS